MDKTSDIFISIASYRDPELMPTLTDLVAHAANPASLHVSVCWQDNEDLDVFIQAGMVLQETRTLTEHTVKRFELGGARIDIIVVHYYTSRGACWARNLCEKLYQNEPYFLQIDSHCRFIPDWDKEMIAMLTELQSRSPRPIISTYPPAYTPGEDEEASKKQYVSRLIFREFDPHGLPMLSSTTFNTEEPVRGSYIAGGFIFSTGSFVKEIPNDPQIFFAGEEIAMAVRAFTHGYDIYHPHKPLLWHFYGRREFTKVWDDHNNKAKEQGDIDKAWWEWDKVAKNRVRILLGFENENAAVLSPYTLGTHRTLREFEYQAGICLKRGTVLPEVIGKECTAFFATIPEDEEAWLDRQLTHSRKVITLNKDECDTSNPELESLHLGVYSNNNILLHKQVITAQELSDLRAKSDKDEMKITINFQTTENIKPAVVRFTPWLEDTGWGSITEKAW